MMTVAQTLEQKKKRESAAVNCDICSIGKGGSGDIPSSGIVCSLLRVCWPWLGGQARQNGGTMDSRRRVQVTRRSNTRLRHWLSGRTKRKVEVIETVSVGGNSVWERG
jgi:hypothetical protein